MKKMALVLALICCCSFAGCSTQVVADEISPQVVRNYLISNGAAATRHKYFACDDFEHSVYPSIESGDSEWVRLAEEMLPHSDACVAESIQSALGKAMQQAPENVLPLVDKNAMLRADRVCLPFISSELPKREQHAEIERSRTAIERVTDPSLGKQKEACLRFIRGVEELLSSP